MPGRSELHRRRRRATRSRARYRGRQACATRLLPDGRRPGGRFEEVRRRCGGSRPITSIAKARRVRNPTMAAEDPWRRCLVERTPATPRKDVEAAALCRGPEGEPRARCVGRGRSGGAADVADPRSHQRGSRRSTGWRTCGSSVRTAPRLSIRIAGASGESLRDPQVVSALRREVPCPVAQASDTAHGLAGLAGTAVAARAGRGRPGAKSGSTAA